LNEVDLMVGFSPDAEGQVTLANWRKAPYNRWSFTHVRELIPTAAIANDPSDIADLPSAPEDFEGLEFEFDGSRYDLARFLARTQTDGLRPERLRLSRAQDRNRQDVVTGPAARRTPDFFHPAWRGRGDAPSWRRLKQDQPPGPPPFAPRRALDATKRSRTWPDPRPFVT